MTHTNSTLWPQLSPNKTLDTIVLVTWLYPYFKATTRSQSPTNCWNKKLQSRVKEPVTFRVKMRSPLEDFAQYIVQPSRRYIALHGQRVFSGSEAVLLEAFSAMGPIMWIYVSIQGFSGRCQLTFCDEGVLLVEDPRLWQPRFFIAST